MTTRVLLFSMLVFGTLHAENHLTTTATQRYFNVVRRNLEASADAMPAEKYSFRLTDGQMTFAEWLIHATQRNFSDCAILKSEPVSDAERKAASLKEKGEVSKALKDLFASRSTRGMPLSQEIDHARIKTGESFAGESHRAAVVTQQHQRLLLFSRFDARPASASKLTPVPFRCATSSV